MDIRRHVDVDVHIVSGSVSLIACYNKINERTNIYRVVAEKFINVRVDVKISA